MARQQKIILYIKGVNTKTSDLLMAEDEAKDLVNVDLSKYGILQKRYGYVQMGDQITANKEILGLLQYYNSDDTSQLIAGCNTADDTKIQISARTQQNYYWNVLNDAYPNTRFEGANFINYLYIVGYSATDDTFLPTLSWNGTTTGSKDGTPAGTIIDTNLANCPQGKYACVTGDFLLIANGRDSDGNRFNSRVWWADPGLATVVYPIAITWDTTGTNWEEFYPNNGQEITGIITNSNRAIIFKNTSTHIWDTIGQTKKVISDSTGCDSHRSIQNVGNFTIFYNRKGVYATNGSDVQLISNPVEKFIDAIDQDTVYEICAGVKDNKYYHLFIGDVTVNGTSYTNCELVYDVLQNSWTVNELSHKVTVYCNYTQPTITTTTSTVTTSSSSSSSSSISSSTSSQSTSSSSQTTSSSSSSTSSETTSSSSESSTSESTSSSSETTSSSSSSSETTSSTSITSE